MADDAVILTSVQARPFEDAGRDLESRGWERARGIDVITVDKGFYSSASPR